MEKNNNKRIYTSLISYLLFFKFYNFIIILNKLKSILIAMNRYYYWKDNDNNYLDLKYQNNGKYLCFEPWSGGFNNIRMSFELATCLAYLLNRTLIIPPSYQIYLLSNESNLNDFFDFKDCSIDIISFDDFCHIQKIDQNKNIREKWEDIKYLSELIDWNLENGLIYFDGILDLEIVKDRTIHTFNNHQLLSSVLFFDKNLLGNFYLMIQTKKLNLLCYLIKYNIHYKSIIFDLAHIIIKHLGTYYSIHIRRNDFQYSDKRTPTNELYQNIKDLIPINSKLYIATDSSNLNEFSELSKYYKLVFFKDVNNLLPGSVNHNLFGLIEQIICSHSELFIGTELSTFSSYIYRLRGYQKKLNLDYWVHNELCLKNKNVTKTDITKNDIFPLWKDNWINNWGREYPESWILSKSNNLSLNNQKLLKDNKENNIFVSIASYRDPQLIPTIENLLEKSQNVNRIFLGICLQDDQDHLDNFKYKNHPQIRIINIDYKEARGCCYARSLIQKKLYQGEKYFLQIDSHMRFRKNWDKILIEQLKECSGPKSILSTYPNNYNITDNNEEYLINNKLQVIGILSYNPDGYLNVQGVKVVDKLSPQLWIAAGFIFTYGDWISEVPYDERLYFKGEEDSLTIRSYTFGWNIYCPSLAVIYHCYHDNRLGSLEKYRPLHWEDKQIINHNYQALNQLYNNINHKEIILGSCRSIKEFEKYYGLNFNKRSVEEWSSQGLNFDQIQTNLMKKKKKNNEYILNVPNYNIEEANLWVVVLYNRNKEEKLRVDISDSLILSRRNNQIKIIIDNMPNPTDLITCSIWPRNNQNSFGKRIYFNIMVKGHHIVVN